MMKETCRRPWGITLIEVLIVAGIVSILAMIAVPRLLETQTRAKVARVKSELRKGAMALEAFHFDHKWYPPDGFWLMNSWGQVIGAMPWVDDNCRPWFTPQQAWDIIRGGGMNLWRFDNQLFLTTPVAYLASFPKDPFTNNSIFWNGTLIYANFWDRWQYSAQPPAGDPNAQPLVLNPSAGAWDIDGVRRPFWVLQSAGPDQALNSGSNVRAFTPYDPSNGTMSVGDIFAAGPK